MEVTQKLTTQGTIPSSGHTHTEEEWTDDCGNVAVAQIALSDPATSLLVYTPREMNTVTQKYIHECSQQHN